jgi:hypothetical protein
MMDKPKRKNEEQGLWGALVDAVLLARPFEYEVDGTPAQWAKQLEKLEAFKRGFLQAATQDVTVTQVHTQTYDFQIDMQRYGRNLSYYTARAAGSITIDKGIEKTIVRGKVRMGRVIFFGLIAILLEIAVIVILLPEIFEVWWFFILYIGAHFAVLLFNFADYGKMNALIRDTFSPDSEPKKKKHDG